LLPIVQYSRGSLGAAPQNFMLEFSFNPAPCQA
jgi:hypothetical protein